MWEAKLERTSTHQAQRCSEELNTIISMHIWAGGFNDVPHKDGSQPHHPTQAYKDQPPADCPRHVSEEIEDQNGLKKEKNKGRINEGRNLSSSTHSYEAEAEAALRAGLKADIPRWLLRNTGIIHKRGCSNKGPQKCGHCIFTQLLYLL